mmetsp:Transcript_17937/g.41833  ORF Transcript_17937/g.41833 Transcript_17937/m.41833 type:complete len:425 (+) Transcript_17937:55-1329(+)
MLVDVLVGRGKYLAIDVPEGCTVGSWKQQLSDGSLGDKILYATKLSCYGEENGRALAEAAALPPRIYVDGPFSVLQMLELGLKKKLGPGRGRVEIEVGSPVKPPREGSFAGKPCPEVIEAIVQEANLIPALHPPTVPIRFHCAGLQGWRPYMEDRTCAVPMLPHCGFAGLYGVFDGHGGADVAEACVELLPGILAEAMLRVRNPEGALHEAFRELDYQLRIIGQPARGGANNYDRIGSTACVALVLQEAEDKPRHLICANCGDSRAVLCRSGGEAVDMSSDHKPNHEEERNRIVAAGGRVDLFGPCWRVDAGLNLSRAMGDFWYKAQSLPRDEQKVISVPSLRETDLQPDDEFLVIGSDGIFDVLSSQDLVDSIRADLAAGLPIDEALDSCLQRCMASGDNVSLCLVQFSDSPASVERELAEPN